jgi:hypothetical protein
MDGFVHGEQGSRVTLSKVLNGKAYGYANKEKGHRDDGPSP